MGFPNEVRLGFLEIGHFLLRNNFFVFELVYRAQNICKDVLVEKRLNENFLNKVGLLTELSIQKYFTKS